MHVYHYGVYEPAALKQLMGVYATREDAVDELLRREVFVDLHGVVRQGLRAGRVELLAQGRRGAAGLSPRSRRHQRYARRAGLRAVDAHAGRGPSSGRSRRTTRRTAARRCRSATGCCEHRPPGTSWATPPDRRPVSDDRQKADRAREALRQTLLAGSDPGEPRWLIAELLEYHRREARPAWWWFFQRCQMSADELVEDGEAIGRLRARRPAARPQAILEHRFTFQIQPHKLAAGDDAVRSGHGQGRRDDRRARRDGGRARSEILDGGRTPRGADSTTADHDDRAAPRTRAPGRCGADRRPSLSRAARHRRAGAAAIHRSDRRDGPDH